MRLTTTKYICLFILLLGSILGNILIAQTSKPIQFNNIQKTEGLPNNTVNKIIKDKYGFLWIATNDGLCRYDGPNQMTIFHADTSQNMATLNASNIRTLYADSRGNLWIGTRLGGLTRYHQSTETWTTFKHEKGNNKSISNDEILTITEDSQHRLWVGTENGLNLYDYETATFTNFLVDREHPYSLKTKAILTITEDDQGWIWVGTWAGGLHLLLTEENEAITNGKFRNILPSNNKAAHNVWKVYQDRQKRYWVGTHGGGLFLMHLPKDASNKIAEQSWTPKFHSYVENERDSFSLSSDAVQDILQDSNGQLWIAMGHGISIIDAENLPSTTIDYFATNDKPAITFNNYLFDANDLNSLAGNNVMSILEDEQGLIWLATTSGISQYNWYTSQFDVFDIFGQTYKTPNAQNLFIDDQQIAWIGAGKNGVLQYDLNDRTLRSFSNQHPTLFIDTYVSCIVTSDKKWLYVGSKLGVTVINIKTLVSKKFPTPAWLRKNIKDFYIQEIFVDKAQTIWVGTELGLFAINQQNGVYTNYERIEGDSTSISDNSINSIVEDEDNNIWIATYNGLNKASKNETGALIFERFFYDVTTKNSIISNQVTALKKINNQLFIGTTSGLCSYDLKRKQFKDHSNLGHKYWIQSITESTEDDIWASTTEGILHFDIKNNFINAFEQKDGLGDLTFRLGSCAKDEKNCIYFGNRTGITRFHPDKIVKNKQAPPVFITSLKKINPKGETIYKGINQKEITLHHDDYLLSINFAALNYNRGEKNKYIYQLEGFDDTWHSSKFGNPIVYTNLAPKTYTFRVKAANNDGVWNETGTTLTIIKQPAFWQTWWFQLAFLVGIGLLLIVGVQLYTQNIRNRNLTLKSYNHKLNKEIEERNRFEKALANRERFLRLIMDSVPQYIYWVDTNLQFQGVNKNLLKLLNFPSEADLIGKKAIDLNLPATHVNAQESLMQKVLDTKKPIFNYIYQTPDVPNFPKIWLDHNYMPLKNENNEIIGVLVSATNISTRVKNEVLAKERTQKLSEFNEELKRSNKDLEQFAYIASHDLKEPLRIIGNFSGLLARSYKTQLDQDAFQYIDFIEDGVKRMSNLINSLLTYSRVGRKEAKFQNIDLNKLVGIKLFDLSEVVKERNAKVIVEKLPTIYGEPEQIGMVFHNLINNAIKFNKQAIPTVTIKVETSSNDDFWEFSVADNGIGIDPRYQQQIFEIFRRLHGKRDYEGTGIGLSVCQKIVFRHDGKIWLTSELDKGTTFHFTISKQLVTKQLNEKKSVETLVEI